MKEYSYTSTPPMGRTACTELQCLYKGDLHLTLKTIQCNFSVALLLLEIEFLVYFLVFLRKGGLIKTSF